MNVLLDLLTDQSIETAPLSLIGQLLCDFNMISRASAVEQVTLVTRISTLLRSNHTHIRWRATRLFQLVVRHPALLLNTSHIGNCLAALVKIMESKCYIQDESNPSQRELICLRATVESVDFAMDRIRGKANLTREVLTPKISGIIGGLIGLIRVLPNQVIPVLYKLILAHSNTFRPFGTKLEKELLVLLANGSNIDTLDAAVLHSCLKCLALLSFNLSRNDVAEQWALRTTNLIQELASVLSLYESLLDLDANPTYTTKIKSLPLQKDASTKNYLFGTLNIDVNESPLSIRQASDRISLLLLLIQAQLQISTPNVVSVPLGHLLSLTTLLANLPTLASIKTDVRGEEPHNAIKASLLDIQKSALSALINIVDIFSSDIFPHMYDILATMDSAVPVVAKNGKLHVNKSQVIENKDNIKLVIKLSSKCLALVERWSDMSILTRVMDSSFFLTEAFQLPNPSSIPTAGQAIPQQQGSGKKKSNKKSNISFSDYLSNPKSFQEHTNKETMQIIRTFFLTLVQKCELNTGKLNTIVRWAILDSLAGGNVDTELLEAIVIYPGKADGAISAYPMIVNLLGNKGTPVTNLLMNPRLPLLPQLATSSSTRETIMEEDEEEEDEVQDDQPQEGTAVSIAITEITNIGNDLKRKFTDEADNLDISEKKVKTDHQDMIVNTVSEENVEKMKRALIEEDVQVSKIENAQPEATEQSDDEELGSDFEIPEINVD